MTPADLLERELRRDGARPLITWYDDGTGERVELSVATAGNWAAKIANLLVDDFDLGADDDVGVLLPAHWETAVVLLGCWRAGAHVRVGVPAWVTFHLEGHQAGHPGRAVELSLRPMGADLSRVVAAQPDQFGGGGVDGSATALSVGDRSWTHGELAGAAALAAAQHGLGADSRVLSTLPYDTVNGLDAGLLVPLAAGGSVVLVGSAADGGLPDKCATENVTHTAGVTVAGLPRLDR